MAKTGFQQKIEQELTCAVCLSPFTEPKVLPCLHTFCQPCIESLVLSKTHDKNVVDCPTCRQQYELPEAPDIRSSVAKIRTNFTLKSLTELLQSDTNVVQCGNFVDDNPAVCRCMDCHVYLCQDCKAIHGKQKATRTHKLASLDEMKKEEGKLVRPVQYCPEHASEVIALYCLPCRKAICRDCTLITHSKHDYKFIRDMGNYFETRLKDAVRVLDEKEKEFYGYSGHVKSVVAELDAHHQTSKASIESTFSAYAKLLNRCECELLEDLSQQHHAECKAALAERERMDLILTKLSTNLVFCKRLLQSGDDVERAAMDNSVAENVSSLRSETWDTEKLRATSWPVETGDMDAFLRAHKVVATNLSASSFTLEDCNSTHVGLNQVTLKGVGDIPDAIIGTLLAVQVIQTPSDKKEAVKSTNVPVKIIKVGAGCWKCTYFLERRGQYMIRALCNGVEVPGSPAQCNAQNLKVGMRVCRGSDWKWGLQDTGVGIGTVAMAKDEGWITVAWDKGSTNNYRWGAEGAYDVSPKEDEAMPH